MKKSILAASLAAIPALGMAQAAVDVANLSQWDLRGTARFMSMGGAFTALGGDLSTLNQNPAGIGIYRGSEVGLTLDLDLQSTKTSAQGRSFSNDNTRFAVNNFGYIGTVRLYKDMMPSISFGATYARVTSFDRVFSGGIGNLGGASLSNYVAAMTNAEGNIPTADMQWRDNYNPYLQSSAPWLSILSYQGFAINDNADTNSYQGLMGDDTYGNAEFKVREKGYVDEYNISVGGNIANTVYWGLGVGITDLDYRQQSYYQENLSDAYIAAERGGDGAQAGAMDIVRGQANYRLTNYLQSTGSGVNVKLGVILKPINEFRIGLAVHTPTWYNMTDTYWGLMDYEYTPSDPNFLVNASNYSDAPMTNDGESGHDYRIRTPWRLMAGAAGVIGGQAIVSLDYEYRGDNMRVSDDYGNEYDGVTSDVKTYFKPVHIVRLGAEYRVTPQFSLRAGYSYQTSPVRSEAANDGVMIWTAGTIPSYTFNKTTQYVTAGLGYRFSGFYADLAYVYRTRTSTYHAFSPILTQTAVDQHSPSARVEQNNSQIVLSVGYKF